MLQFVGKPSMPDSYIALFSHTKLTLIWNATPLGHCSPALLYLFTECSLGVSMRHAGEAQCSTGNS